MTEGKPYLPWPGGDDKIVVAEMLRDSLSGQWYECCEFIKWLVRVQATNISRDHWDDIVQEAMIRVNKYLPTFQFHCKLRIWLFSIVRSCIIDFYRKFIRVEEALDPIDDTQDVVEGEV
jgi:RNA polymerase sigma factor (sigma-70 family)